MNGYQQHQEFNAIYDEVISHSTISSTLLKLKFRDVQTLASGNLHSVSKAIACELDFVHRLLKHKRHCEDLASCAVERLYFELQTFILELVGNTKETTASHHLYSLLTCVNDLIKNFDADLPGPADFPYDQILHFSVSFWMHKKNYICRRSMEICSRLLISHRKRISSSQAQCIIDALLKYVDVCKQKMSKEGFLSLAMYETGEQYTEFYYSESVTTGKALVMDRVTVKYLLQITLDLVLYSSMNCCEEPLPHLLTRLLVVIEELYKECTPLEFIETIYSIYCVNDDAIVELLNSLCLYRKSQHRIFLETVNMTPDVFFLHFLQVCGSDHQIIIDLLVDDVMFLRFFLRYAADASIHFDSFLRAAKLLEFDLGELEKIFEETLRVLKAEGFPYNATPLVKVLKPFYDKICHEKMLNDSSRS